MIAQFNMARYGKNTWLTSRYCLFQMDEDCRHDARYLFDTEDVFKPVDEEFAKKLDFDPNIRFDYACQHFQCTAFEIKANMAIKHDYLFHFRLAARKKAIQS